MSLFLYNIAIRFYFISIKIGSLFNEKASLWISGRRQWREKVSKILPAPERRIWIHCASVGEFEQARNLIEYCKKSYTDTQLVLSFYSPSGYELRKDYLFTDHVFYLPLDTAANARDLLNLLAPDLIIFVKYEFWYHILHAAARKKIPVILYPEHSGIASLFLNGMVDFSGKCWVILPRSLCRMSIVKGNWV